MGRRNPAPEFPGVSLNSGKSRLIYLTVGYLPFPFQYCFDSPPQPADPFSDGLFLQRAIRDAQVTAIRHSKSGSGNRGDAVFTNQTLNEIERVEHCINLQQKVKGPISRRHQTKMSDCVQLIQYKFAHFGKRL